MATVYLADTYPGQPAATTDICADISQFFSFLVSVALVINDTIKLCKIPKGAEVLDFIIDMPDLDSATSLAWDLGDSLSAARYVSASTKGQSAAIICHVNDGVVSSLPYAYLINDDLILKVNTAPGGGGTSATPIKGHLRYSMRAPGAF